MGPILGGLFGACIYDAFLYTGENNIFAKQFVHHFSSFLEDSDFSAPSCINFSENKKLTTGSRHLTGFQTPAFRKEKKIEKDYLYSLAIGHAR
jgi:hypothetical protein